MFVTVRDAGCTWSVEYSRAGGEYAVRHVRLILVGSRSPVMADEPQRLEAEFMRRLSHPGDGLLDRVIDTIVNGDSPAAESFPA